MRLKEAQLLGVLAIIAGGIIVLSLWSGGSEDKDAAAQQQSQAADAKAQPQDTANPEDWLSSPAQGKQRSGAASSQGAAASVRVDGSVQPAAPRADLATAELDKMLLNQSPTPLLQGQAPAPQIAQADQGAARVHVVKRGDTLGAISAKYLGSSAKWKFILEANRGIINKPEDLRIGMKLDIPTLDKSSAPAAAAAAPAAPVALTAVTLAPAAPGQAAQPAVAGGAKFYDVERGDSLWLIAKKVYGNANDWKKIQEANKDQLGESGKALKPGMRLVIP